MEDSHLKRKLSYSSVSGSSYIIYEWVKCWIYKRRHSYTYYLKILDENVVSLPYNLRALILVARDAPKFLQQHMYATCANNGTQSCHTLPHSPTCWIWHTLHHTTMKPCY